MTDGADTSSRWDPFQLEQDIVGHRARRLSSGLPAVKRHASGHDPLNLRFRVDPARVFRGSESIVSRADELDTQRPVTLKTPRDATHPEQLERFLAEGVRWQRLAAAARPYVPELYYFYRNGELGEGAYYLIGEWLDLTLDDWLSRNATQTLEQKVALLERLLQAVQAVHQAGLIHRDVCPSNILLSADLQTVKIADFGIAVEVGGNPPTLKETYQYYPPEAYNEKVLVDQRVDVYSLGMIAYELLLGRQQFRRVFQSIYASASEAQRNQEWMVLHTDRQRLPALHSIDPTLPEALGLIVEQMLEKDPERRYADCEQVLVALAATDWSTRPRPLPPPPPVQPGRGQRLLAWLKTWQGASAALLIMVLSGVLLLALVQRNWGPFHEAFEAMEAARQVAIAAGADQSPVIPPFTEGEQLREQARQASDNDAAEQAIPLMIQARERYVQARLDVLRRSADAARTQMTAAQTAVEQMADALGGELTLPAYAEGTQLASAGEQRYTATDFGEAYLSFQQATVRFEAAKQELLDRLAGRWEPRIALVRREAEEARLLAQENQATTRAEFRQGEASFVSADELRKAPLYEEAEQAFRQARDVFLLAAALQARERMQGLLRLAQENRFDPNLSNYAEGVRFAESGEARFNQRAYRPAVADFNNASKLLELLISEISYSPVTVMLGSTAEDIDTAYRLCEQYRQPQEAACTPDWYRSETYRQVVLQPFVLDVHEVTYREFAEFVAATDYVTTAEQQRLTIYWDGMRPLTVAGFSWRTPNGPNSSYESVLDYPVAYISQTDASAYCRWKNARLPSEDEWEYAARGMERRLYAWGNEWQADRLTANSQRGPLPIQSSPRAATPGQLDDLTGSVWEWTSTGDDNGYVLKGGSWLEHNPAQLRAAGQLLDKPDTAQFDYGFRCAKTVARWEMRF